MELCCHVVRQSAGVRCVICSLELLLTLLLEMSVSDCI